MRPGQVVRALLAENRQLGAEVERLRAVCAALEGENYRLRTMAKGY